MERMITNINPHACFTLPECSDKTDCHTRIPHLDPFKYTAEETSADGETLKDEVKDSHKMWDNTMVTNEVKVATDEI